MSKKQIFKKIVDNIIWLLLILVCGFFGIYSKNFFTFQNALNILAYASILGIMAVGQIFPMITGNLDLSMEATMGLCALLGIWLISPAGEPLYGSGFMLPVWLSILIILLVGLLVGSINGFLILNLKINSFIACLSSQIIIRGILYIITYGATTYSQNEVYNSIASGKIGPINHPLSIMLLCFLLGYIVLKYTKFGRELYAIGANQNAAFASGVNVNLRIRQVYIICSIFAVLAGLLLSSRLTAAEPTTGKGTIFTVYAAAVVGGISIFGGTGSIIGAFGGVLLLSTINSGLNLMNVSVYWVEAIRGLIILLAMIIDAQKYRVLTSASKDNIDKSAKITEMKQPTV